MAEQPKLNEKLTKLTADAAADAKLKQRLQEQPLSVLKEYGIEVGASVEAKELGERDLEKVTGGMKYTKGTENSNVVDARGGSYRLGGLWTVDLDVNGKVSSIRQGV